MLAELFLAGGIVAAVHMAVEHLVARWRSR